jgi:hypothetical protein
MEDSPPYTGEKAGLETFELQSGALPMSHHEPATMHCEYSTCVYTCEYEEKKNGRIWRYCNFWPCGKLCSLLTFLIYNQLHPSHMQCFHWPKKRRPIRTLGVLDLQALWYTILQMWVWKLINLEIFRQHFFPGKNERATSWTPGTWWELF